MQLKEDTAPNQQSGAKLARLPLLQVYSAQILLLIAVFLVISMRDITLAISILAGGLISVAPNAYFARWAFRFSGARSAADVTRSFYRGEAGKFVFTAALFATTFAMLRPINEAAIFFAYIFMMALNWILALRFFKR